MAKTASSFSRKGNFLKPQPKILIICEDTKSGKKYIEDMADHYRVRLEVEISHCGKNDPKGIVESAVSRKSEFELIYCMIDRDNHAKFDQAMDQIKSHSEKIKSILSFPCFEYWVLLHYENTTMQFNSLPNKSPGKQLISYIRKKFTELSEYDKSIDFDLFNILQRDNKLNAAITRSKNILAQAITAGDRNPSTEMHILIDLLDRLRTPQKVR